MKEFKDVYEDVLYKLENDINFHFVRYGDGEWSIILKNNVYDHLLKKWGDSLKPFSKILRDIVESKPQYYFGIQNLAYRNWHEEIDILTKDMNLVKADIFHSRSQKNTIKDFFNILSNKNVILIGPEYLNKISEFKFIRHIVTPEYHVWNSLDKIEKEIEEFISLQNEKIVLIYSCSIASKILIDKFSDKKITQIDTGSLLDPYVGVNSRSYHINVLKRLGKDESTFIYPKIK